MVSNRKIRSRKSLLPPLAAEETGRCNIIAQSYKHCFRGGGWGKCFIWLVKSKYNVIQFYFLPPPPTLKAQKAL